MTDLASRLKNRIQLASDGFAPYLEAVEEAWGADVDYGQIVKSYEKEDESKYTPERKYSPSHDHRKSRSASRSHKPRRESECNNSLARQRLNRLTLAFSKRRENFEAAVALHFAAYNFVRTHASLKMTPAMKADIEKNWWSYGDLVEAVL